MQSNMKFQSMKGNLQGIVNDLHTKNFMLEDENLAVKAEKDYLTGISKDTERKNFENRIEVEKELTDNSEKLRTLQRRFSELTAENNKVTDNFRGIEDDYDKLLRTEKLKHLNNSINENLLKEEQGSTGDDLKEKKGVIDQYDRRLKQADEVFRADPRFTELVEESEQLKERLKRS